MNKNYLIIFLIIVLIIAGGLIIFLQFFAKTIVFDFASSDGSITVVLPKTSKHLGIVKFITPIQDSIRQNPIQTFHQTHIIANSQDIEPSMSNNLNDDPPVSIINLAFSPSSLTINVGDSVTWTNKDNTMHTVTSDSGNELSSAVLQPGDKYSHTFNSPGTFNYHCSIHTFMSGVIFVIAPVQTPITATPSVNQPPSPQIIPTAVNPNPPVMNVPAILAISPVTPYYPTITNPIITPQSNATIIKGSFKGGTAKPFQGNTAKPFGANITSNFKY